MRIHVVDLRMSNHDGLWAELVGHEDPVPAEAVDGMALEADPDDDCARLGCERLAARGVDVHRRHSRRTSEVVGLCAEDFAEHRRGASFLVRVDGER